MHGFVCVFLFIIAINSVYTCELSHDININLDTCESLSIKYSIDIINLLELNDDLNCDKIRETKRVCVKNLTVKRPSIDSCTKIYKVRSGDTCEQIASRNGITLERILLLNPNIDCFYIGKYDNQTICLNSTCLKYYKLNEEDTCEKISEKSNITIERLYHLNKNIDCINMDFTRLCID
jgi:hypothetical protein